MFAEEVFSQHWTRFSYATNYLIAHHVSLGNTFQDGVGGLGTCIFGKTSLVFRHALQTLVGEIYTLESVRITHQ